LFCAEPFQQIDNRPIRRKVLRRKAVKPGSKVGFWVELGFLSDFTREVTHPHRPPRDESYSQLLTCFQNAVTLWVSVHERVFRLNGSHGLHRVGPANRLGTGFRESEMQNFS